MAVTAEDRDDTLAVDVNGTHGHELLLALRRLDERLQQAVLMAQTTWGAQDASDPFRGLYISQDETTQLLARLPGEPLFCAADASTLPQPTVHSERLAWLQSTFTLSAFDLDVLLIALAPEVDLRYERLYAYLQDDVTRKRPTVDLALNLLCSSAVEKLNRRAHFATDAPLLHHKLLHLFPESNHSHAPLLAHTLTVDEQIVDVLLGAGGLDRRLAVCCQVLMPASSRDPLPLADAALGTLPVLIQQAYTDRTPLYFYFQGAPGAGQRHMAEALAGFLGLRLLIVDLARALTTAIEFDRLVALVLREAWLQGAILYLDGLDGLRGDEHRMVYQHLLDALALGGGVTILTGAQPWVPPAQGPKGVIVVPFAGLDFDQRRAAWEHALATYGLSLPTEELDTLADRFRLYSERIADAVGTAYNHALWRAAAPATALPLQPDVTLNDLFSAARAQAGHDLLALARKIEPVYTWNDIILPADAHVQLHDVCRRVIYRQRVLGEWGFERRLSQGKGISALFTGPAGTGKTMAAEILANELGLDLYKIDLASVISKYIGETEKNLERIFSAAEDAHAILFFDEADALFGKRSEVRDAHDRYANIEVAYLLQKMEQYTGLAILATNLRQNMDDAFLRRLQFIVEFPFPDEAQRTLIWQVLFPSQTPRAADIDFAMLARQFRLAGGNIKNIVLGAAFLAAADGGVVQMTHLLQATRREYQKMGKVLSDTELLGHQPAASEKPVEGR